jgi:signal peptidase I
MRNPKGALTELAEVAALALGLYLVITFAIQPVHVIGLSMYPTVDDQDYLIALKLPYHFHGPDRGDIIIMRDPYNPSRDFIKRVIALPGERILLRDGKVYVNERLLVEPYLQRTEPWTRDNSWPASGQEFTLGPGKYFVMGDNRNNSSDSRLFGPVSQNQIEARAWLRLLPVDHVGVIGGSPPYLSTQRLPAAA